MKPTREYIKEKFRKFNKEIFGGELPEIPIELSEAKGYLGLCVYRKTRKLSGGWRYSDFRLRFNIRIDLPENVLEDTIIHEMIHYSILHKQITDSSPHGLHFRHMMDAINRQHGRNISVRHHSSPEQQEQSYDVRRRWHVIAHLRFADGRSAIKVLPRVVPTIIKYYNAFVGDDRLTELKFYLCNDPWFNRFPNSGALKAHFVDPAEAEEHLRGAHVLLVDSHSVCQI